MEKKKDTLLVTVTLVIAIISLGIAFAAFSTTLKINGSATVEMSTWDIHFELPDGTTPGGDPVQGGTPGESDPTATIPVTPIIPTGSSVEATGTLKNSDFTWTAKFKTPGEYAMFKFRVANDGNYNAKVTSINAPVITCTQNGQPETYVCSKITYKVFNETTLGADWSSAKELKLGDTIAAGETLDLLVAVKLENTFKADGSDLPKSTVYVNPSTITVTFGQN